MDKDSRPEKDNDSDNHVNDVPNGHNSKTDKAMQAEFIGR
jgi:hypothetical protein